MPTKPTFSRRRSAHFSDGAFIAAALAAVALTGLIAVGARTWVDRPFAGFFLQADRTIAPVGRASWSDVTASRLYGRTLVAVDGAAIRDSDALERRVAAKPVGSLFTYTLTNGRTTDTVTLASRRFSAADYWAVFGAYLGTGICYVLLAIMAAWALPARRLGRALLLVGGIGGLFMLSSADLYPPAASLRVHALAAAFLPAALLQFALAVGDVRGRLSTVAPPIVWSASALAAASIQFLIGDPAATPWVQATGNATLGLALVAATIALEATRTRVAGSTARLVACAALFGLGVPAGIYLLAGTLGGIPVNASATLAFLFPLAMSVIVLRGGAALAALGAVDVARSRRSI
jgi:hypothetical protein